MIQMIQMMHYTDYSNQWTDSDSNDPFLTKIYFCHAYQPLHACSMELASRAAAASGAFLIKVYRAAPADFVATTLYAYLEYTKLKYKYKFKIF